MKEWRYCPKIFHTTPLTEKGTLVFLFFFVIFAQSPSTEVLCSLDHVASGGWDPAVWNNDLHRWLWYIYGFDSLQGADTANKVKHVFMSFQPSTPGKWRALSQRRLRRERERERLHSKIVKQLVAKEGRQWKDECKSIPDTHLSCHEQRQCDEQQCNCSTQQTFPAQLMRSVITATSPLLFNSLLLKNNPFAWGIRYVPCFPCCDRKELR